MDVTLRFRAYPDDTTASEAWRHIDIHRQIRNHAVRAYYRADYNDRPERDEQVTQLPEWKGNYATFTEVSAHAAQQTVRQIHTDLANLKEKRERGYTVGQLKWQGAGEFRSVAYQSEGFNVNHTTGRDGWAMLTLSKIDGEIPVRTHRKAPDTEAIKRVVLKKERTGEWFVCFTIEADEPTKPDPDDIDLNECVGIDLGILSFIHTSDDLAVDCFDLDAEYERYAREQRSLDRKEHRSNNWEKQRRTVAQAKRHIKRKVADFQHKLARWLVTEYDFIAVEDLDVKPMLETSQSAKNKQDVAWAQFLELLEYKADLHGTHVVRVDPAGTTKECSECGVETAKPIWVREHSCPACGHEEDRDLNATKNILDRGLDELVSDSQIGPGRPESTPTPVETALPTSAPVRANAKRVVERGSPEA
jgi:putative transposase